MPSFAFDPSGLKEPAAEAMALADEESAIIVYLTGVMDDGRPYYAYLAIKPSRYGEFKARVEARQPMAPEQFGAVIATEFESEPTPAIVAMMRDTYGFDEQYLEKLRAGIIGEYRVFLKKSEDRRINDAVAMLKKNQNQS